MSPTESKIVWLQDHFNEILPEHNRHSKLNFVGTLYLEDGLWINYYRCLHCPQKFTVFGRFRDEKIGLLEDIEK
jgi:hypothetical protein